MPKLNLWCVPKKQCTAAEKAIAELQSKLSMSNVALSAERKQRVALEKKIALMREKENEEVSEFRASKDTLKNERAKLMAERAKISEEKKSLASEFSRTKAQLQGKLKKTAQDAEGAQQTLMKRNADLSRQVSSLKDRVAQLEAANQKHAILAREYSAHQKQMRELKVQNSAFKARLGKEVERSNSPVPLSARKLRRMTTAGNVSSPLAKSSKKLPVASVQTPAVKGNKENEAISTIAVSLVAATPPPPRPAKQ